MKLFKKIIVCLLLAILIINSFSYAAGISKELQSLIIEIQKMIVAEILEQGKEQTVENIAQIIRKVCKDDEEKISELHVNCTVTYTTEDGTETSSQWQGNTTDSMVYQAISQALNNIKNGISNDEDTDEKTKNKQDMEDEIYKTWKNATKEQLQDTKFWEDLDKLLKDYLKEYGSWPKTSMLSSIAEQVSNYLKNLDENYHSAKDDADEERQDASDNNDNQHNKPPTAVLGQSNPNASHTPDEVIKEGGDFITTGKEQGSKIDANNLKKASDTLYNILLTLGIIIAVGVGIYLGIKFMLSSAEDKAKVKESLIPYIAGCVVVFGAFIIWKLAITLLGQIG